MKLWLGGEIDKGVAESFREARKAVENAINKVVATASYDVSLDSLDCVAIIRGDQVFAERSTYSSKKRDMDFRLSVDFERFASGSENERRAMLFGLILKAIEMLKSKKGIGLGGIAMLEKDIVTIGANQGWIQSLPSGGGNNPRAEGNWDMDAKSNKDRTDAKP